MCGINGILALRPMVSLPSLIKSMNQQLYQRGPDDEGIWLNEAQTQGMGMRRLAIVDANFAQQPWREQDICLCFNGEIYNYQALKQTLMSLGYQFRTESDTEVLAKAYLYWGTSCFEHFDGMFAIAIMDFKLNKLFLARDINGEKPLYYYCNHEFVIWSSELKGLLCGFEALRQKRASISPEALNWYFRLGFIPAPLSIYQSIFKVQPAQYLSIDLATLQVNTANFWKIPNYIPQFNYQEALSSLNRLIQESVQQQTRTNHASGLLLSGGIDSSILAYWFSKLNPNVCCFSLQTQASRKDESFLAQKIAQYVGLKHEIIPLDFTQVQQQLSETLHYFDEPYSDSSAIASNAVLQWVKKDIKLMYGGDGADEVFGGYQRYLMPIWADKIRQYAPFLKNINHLPLYLFPDNSAVNTMLKFFEKIGKNSSEDVWNISQMGMQDATLNALLLPNWQYQANTLYKLFLTYPLDNPLALARLWDKQIALEGDMLVKTDRMSMRASIEYRTPFLSKYLWEFSQKLPDTLLIQKGNTKYLLKRYHSTLFPESFRQAKKQGFEVPIAIWLSTSLKKELLRLTSIDFLRKQDLFEPLKMHKQVHCFLQKPQRYKFQLWSIYCFQKWYLSKDY